MLAQRLLGHVSLQLSLPFYARVPPSVMAAGTRGSLKLSLMVLEPKVPDMMRL